MATKKFPGSPGRKHISVRSSGSAAKIPMAKADRIPAGRYHSRILNIKEVKTSAGNEAVEVIYLLTAHDGVEHKMREVIPIDDFFFPRFCDAMVDAGLADGDDLLNAVGVEEKVELVYPNPKGLGHFAARTPVTVGEKTPKRDEEVVASDEADDDFDEDFDFDED